MKDKLRQSAGSVKNEASLRRKWNNVAKKVNRNTVRLLMLSIKRRVREAIRSHEEI